MPRAFGIPGLYNTPMKWNKETVDGKQVEWRVRLWYGNHIGLHPKSFEYCEATYQLRKF